MDEIQEIRRLLESVEARLGDEGNAEQLALRNLDALEFPELVAAVIDFLQPVLGPHEAAVYWRLFRLSVLGDGTQYTRASTRGLASGLVLSRSGQPTDLTYSTVQAALQGLESKGAIVKAGDTTRDGTLYKVCLPEEIPLCQERMRAGITEEPARPIDQATELDYYNVRENREKVFERDGFQCHYCKKQLTRFTATLDHIQPVSRGGDNSLGNLVTACIHCNSRRGNRPVMDAIVDSDKTGA
jgi:hypothetical protein